MTPTDQNNSTAAPRPIVKKMRWPFPLIWLVPAIAAIAAGYYLRDYLALHGPQITLRFSDGSGIKPGETPVMRHGVQIGQVTDVRLSPDGNDALVDVQLPRSASVFASQGALFWIVRPEISAAAISGLSTVVTGPYIEAVPGNGPPISKFTGLDKTPPTLAPGLQLILHADRIEHLQSGSPVYFRGIPVGIIQDIQLSPDATRVNARVLVWRHFSPLVRSDSQFWSTSGADVKGGVFSGVEVKLGSLRSLLTGGVIFATPDNPKSQPATDGADFALNDEAKKEWLSWAPQIALAPDDAEQH